MFAFHAVSRWLETWDWKELIAELSPDPRQFESFVARMCSPRWPPTRDEPEMDASVIAVGESLWEVVSPLAETKGIHRVLRVEWQDPQTLVAIRVVQGLQRGWRNFDPLPTATDHAEADDHADSLG